MTHRKSGRRIFVTFFGLAMLLAAMPVIAAQNTGAAQSGDTCGAQLQQVRADLAKQPAADPNMRAQVNEASALCERGDEAEAQKILDQVVKDMNAAPATRTN
ncbi:MAG: hypothetical protein JJ899_00765 [Alphaproteobacteria bacterium]|nr:hypothetical protein [Alphaproteobacteria bacterium]